MATTRAARQAWAGEAHGVPQRPGRDAQARAGTRYVSHAAAAQPGRLRRTPSGHVRAHGQLQPRQPRRGWCSSSGAVVGVAFRRPSPSSALPDPTDTQVNVITLFDGQPWPAAEIGASRLERALNGTPNMTRLRNLSMFGWSMVTLTFRDGTDGPLGQQVLERLREADLPEGDAGAWPLRHAHRRGVPLHAAAAPGATRCSAHPAGMGGAPDDHAQRRGRRGQLRRVLREVIQVKPRPRRWRRYQPHLREPEKGNCRTQNASAACLERGTEQFSQVRRSLQVARRHPQHPGGDARRHPGVPRRRGRGDGWSWPRQGW